MANAEEVPEEVPEKVPEDKEEEGGRVEEAARSSLDFLRSFLLCARSVNVLDFTPSREPCDFGIQFNSNQFESILNSQPRILPGPHGNRQDVQGSGLRV